MSDQVETSTRQVAVIGTPTVPRVQGNPATKTRGDLLDGGKCDLSYRSNLPSRSALRSLRELSEPPTGNDASIKRYLKGQDEWLTPRYPALCGTRRTIKTDF